MGFYIGNIVKQSQGFLMAMIFALLGDVFLMFSDDTSFMIGLIAFLLMQLFYIFEFKKDIKKYSKRQINFLLGFIIVGLLIYFMMSNHLYTLKWPVLIYVLAITTMGAMAWSRNKDIPGYQLVGIGALFFIFSDMWLAFGKFDIIHTSIDRLIVIVSYMIAQYLIVRGIIEKQLKT